ncbi:DgyrCDS1680 [Dimorphilus gyrociliatus]|nr:DgyrCDS1680 [Dimorphilus gyrociliatus]
MMDNGCPDMLYLPQKGTCHALPWAGCGKYKVGEVLTDVHSLDRRYADFSTRHAAMRQLRTLKEMGYEVLSAYELEYYIMKKDESGSYVSLYDKDEYESAFLWTKYEKFMYEIESNLFGAGINIEHMHTEYAGGQFEMTVPPETGVNSADTAILYKNGIKEILGLHEGYLATFMSKPIAKKAGSGCHFNHSLWKDGKPAFYDETKEHGLSDLARYFLAGQLKHARALTAFLAPTYNCYRRIVCPFAAPNIANWGIDSRECYVRVKIGSSTGPYLENRLGGAVANPYLVMASILAAGIDGVRHKMELPEQKAQGPDVIRMPKSLEEALKALEEDNDLKEILGKGLVENYIRTKRGVEVKMFNSDVGQESAEDIEKERQFYMDLL